MYAYYLTLLSFAVMLLKIQHQPYAWELDFTKSRNNDTQNARERNTIHSKKKEINTSNNVIFSWAISCRFASFIFHLFFSYRIYRLYNDDDIFIALILCCL